jgi:hypothetical protein
LHRESPDEKLASKAAGRGSSQLNVRLDIPSNTIEIVVSYVKGIDWRRPDGGGALMSHGAMFALLANPHLNQSLIARFFVSL